MTKDAYSASFIGRGELLKLNTSFKHKHNVVLRQAWRYINGSTVGIIHVMPSIAVVRDKYGVWYEFRTPSLRSGTA